MNFAKWFRDLRYRIFYGAILDRSYPLTMWGNTSTGCAWSFYRDALNADSIVYSGGVGNDISFEHQLVEQIGCSVVLFDPSQTGLTTMQRPENQTPRFQFFPVALSDHVGHLHLAPPTNEEEGSWFGAEKGSGTQEVPCTDLAALMRQNHHDHIDLLKIDIEGAEYDVLRSLLAAKLPVRQILVEYHHGMLPGFRRGMTISSMLQLWWRGYRVLDQSGNNHTFFHPGKPGNQPPLR